VSGLEARLEELSARVDAWMRAFLDGVDMDVGRLRRMIGYHLGWESETLETLAQPVSAGKRLRPALCLFVAQAVGADTGQASAPAVALELVHNFSLVHDDIQDQSDMRRHRPTVWRLWGAPQAINVGDGLFALAQLALVGGRHTNAASLVEATERLNRTCLELVEGQFLDLELQHAPEASVAEYRRMVDGKTAALFRCAAELGALYGGASPHVVRAYGAFGLRLGRAFQYQDDLLGAWGEPTLTGKPGATDLQTKKKGLPAALGFEMLSGPAAARLRALYCNDCDLPDDEVEELQALLERGGVREAAQQMVRQGYDEALEALRQATASKRPSGEPLFELCNMLRSRRT
jgi:geranylgeranyl diphosphate synthase type I